LLGAACFTFTAHAQQVELSASQALFEEARQLMLENHLGEACPKFKESLRLDPALGTLLNLALCHEKQGKSATAYLEYTDAVAQAAREGDSERQALAEQRLAALEPHVIRLSIRLAFRAPTGLWIKLDGTGLDAVALGVPLPVDPGAHTVEYGAPGQASKEIGISVSESELRPELSLETLETSAPAAPALPKRASAQTPAPIPGDRGGGMSERTLAVGLLFGGSAAALAFGAYSGFQAGAEWSKRNDHCPDGCDPSAKAFGSNAQRFATISNLSFATSLAAAGAGIYLLVTAPSQAPAPKVGITALALPGSALVSVTGEL
jgi:hypothetical protein